MSWVAAAHAVDAELRLYDRLFSVEDPEGDKEKDFKAFINPDSLEILTGSKVEPGLRSASVLEHFQFERQGYFNVDPDSAPEKLIFNKTVGLRDNWARMQQKKP